MVKRFLGDGSQFKRTIRRKLKDEAPGDRVIFMWNALEEYARFRLWTDASGEGPMGRRLVFVRAIEQ